MYTGDCAQGAGGSQVWSYTSSSFNKPGSGSWKKQRLSVKDSKNAGAMVANFLSSGVAFSSIVGASAANTALYFFGGMCPSQNDTASDWQSAANYSNLVVALQPSTSSDDVTAYQLDVLSSRGPPVPEAGFTMTSLSPTFSNRSDGTQTQQQNYVIVGGHTSAAFINMSQVALFSLPEQSWTFIGVEEPDTSRTDLAIRTDVSTVDPRSGHTAVLTSDGQRIIIVGGWVGDINTPAEPQIAILNVADGYGGNGDWRWLVPSTSGSGFPANTGLFGHGAVMLPGNVMMISGGQLTTSTKSKQKRTTPSANSMTYFLNVTSFAWTTEYSMPSQVPHSSPSKDSSFLSPARKVGLGIGIVGATVVVCGLLAFYIWHRKRLNRQRASREKVLQDFAASAHRYNVEDYSSGIDGRGGHSDALDYLASQNGSYYFPQGAQGGQGWRATSGRDAERTGLLVEIPSPTRGLRRSLGSRPGYAMSRVHGPGHIHPIDELEEEQDEEQSHDDSSLTKHPEMIERRPDQRVSTLTSNSELDPFADRHGGTGNLTGAYHLAPTSPAEDDSNRSEYIPADWPLGAPVTFEQRSSSPNGKYASDKSSSDRTGSNLSEKSNRSSLSWATSNGAVRRSASLRAAAILNGASSSNPFNTPSSSPTHERSRRNSDSGRQSPMEHRTQSFTSTRSSGFEEMESFHSTHSSFAHLQAEGEILLGGNPERPRPGTSSSISNTYRDTEGVNSRAATATPTTSYALDFAASRPGTRERRRSWLGSVRRVLTRSTSSAERTKSLTTAVSYSEPYTDNPASTVDRSSKDTTASFAATSMPPRRAASDASFWRNRRGKQDWLDEETDPTWRRTAGDDWGTPEDIAMAERERQRQEWRDRGNLLVDIAANDELPPPHSPIRSDQLGRPSAEDRPCTPASELDWDVEAAVERRVVQVMFTVPKSKLRVVNADEDHGSVLSLQRDISKGVDEVQDEGEASSPSSRVKDIAGMFEQMASAPASPRLTPRPSPSPSIKSMKIRSKASSASIATQNTGKNVGTSPLSKGNGKLNKN